jgi:hypothetical protein
VEEKRGQRRRTSIIGGRRKRENASLRERVRYLENEVGHLEETVELQTKEETGGGQRCRRSLISAVAKRWAKERDPKVQSLEIRCSISRSSPSLK